MTVYRERLYPAWWFIIAVFLVVPTTVLIFLPLSILVGLTSGLVMWLGSITLLWALSPLIVVDQEGIRAGKARITHAHVDSVEVIESDRARVEKGPGLDARAWLVLRPWVGPAVKITLRDENDPTPYWLVSSRNPRALAQEWARHRGN